MFGRAPGPDNLALASAGGLISPKTTPPRALAFWGSIGALRGQTNWAMLLIVGAFVGIVIGFPWLAN